MRPIRLEMKGFGPFIEPTVIDFTVFPSDDIYLISGKTGAGKTTIFDAITYALYGQSSGSEKEAYLLRNLNVRTLSDSYVDFLFSIHNKQYRIYREVPLMEYEESKNGSFKQNKKNGKTEIYEEGNLLIIKNIDEKVQELLGLTKDQFCTICLIAQGKFSELLTATTSTKAEIFRALFHTKRHEELTNLVSSDYSDLEGELKSQKQLIGSRFSSATCDNTSKYNDRLKSLKEYGEQVILKDAVDVLVDIVEEDKKIQKKIEEKGEKSKKELGDLNREIGKYEGIQQAEDGIKQAEKDRKEELKRNQKLKKKIDQFNQNQEDKKIEELKNDYESVEKSIQKYTDFDTHKQDLEQWKAKQKADKEEQKKIGEEEKKIRKEIELQSEVMRKNKNAAIQYEQEKQKKGSLDTELNRFLGLQKIVSECQNLEDEKQIVKDKQQAKYDEFERLQKELADKESYYVANQAGLLAKRLKKGEACPVCGSTEHKQIAHMQYEGIDENVVRKARKEKDDAYDEIMQMKNQIIAKDTAIAEKENAYWLQIKPKEKKLLDQKSILKHISWLEEQVKQVQQQIQQQNQIVDNWLEKKEAFELAEKEKEALEEKRNDITTRKDAIEKDLIKAQENITNENNWLTNIKKELRFSSSQKANEYIQSTKEKYRIRKETYENALKDYSESNHLLQTYEERKKSFESILAENKTKNITALLKSATKKRDTLLAQETIRDNEMKLIIGRIKTNEDILVDLHQLESSLQEKEERFVWLKKLKMTLSGSITGQQKISFENYVQIFYLDRVLKFANHRLTTLSHGQYALRRKQLKLIRQKQVLDFDVVHLKTNQAISCQTLSGGERFLASLSLALGLSDEVSHSTGEVLECMFVDEGFGTLDKDHLKDSIKVLKDLALSGRLVGIISHVEELDEKVVNKILVEKKEDQPIPSSTVRMIVE